MAYIARLLIVANPGIESEEVRDLIVERAAAGPVEITLVAPVSIGGGALCEARTATGRRVERAWRKAAAERLERVVQLLREAGVSVAGVVGGDPEAPQEAWDPSQFDEVVVSCRPWLSVTRSGECAAAGP